MPESGQSQARYRLVEKLGEGGMGVVWRARDEKLRRDVALKVLPPELAEDPERRRRLIHEARAEAAVNHPNVAAVYDVDESEGQVFFAMELVEGVSLRERLLESLPLSEALRCATEIAEGLASAHAASLVHRDLKPENVMVRPDGHVKILDFGLAKARAELSRSNLSQAETLTGELTREGRVLGTAPYMSPEQARGDPLDARSDIFSFGSLLYEMVTSQTPFEGRTATDTLSAILRDRPPAPSSRKAELPPEIDRIVGKCLEKEPRDRYQDAADLAVDLRKLRRAVETGAAAAATPGGGLLTPSMAATRAPHRLRGLGWAAGVVLTLVLAATGYWWIFVHPGSLEKDDRILVAQLENLTDRADYGIAVTDVLESMLAPSEFLEVIRRPQARELVAAQGGEGSVLSRSVAESICRAGSCEGYVTGKLAAVEAGYRLEASLFVAGRKRPLTAASRVAPSEEDLAEALRDVAVDLRRGAGEAPESLPSRGRLSSNSLLALQAYSQAVLAHLAGDVPTSLRLIDRAIELDPNYVEAWHGASFEYTNLGRKREARRCAREAFERSGHLPETTRLRYELVYLATKYEFDAEMRGLREYLALVPTGATAQIATDSSENAGFALAELAWNHLFVYRDPASAEEPRRRAYRDFGRSGSSLQQLALALLLQGKMSDIDEVVEDFRSHGGSEEWAVLAELAALLRGSWETVDAGLDRIDREATLRRYSGHLRLHMLLAAGRLEDARRAAASAWQYALEASDRTRMQFVERKDRWLESRRTGRPIQFSREILDYFRDNLTYFPEFVMTCLELGVDPPLGNLLADHEAYEVDSASRFVQEELRFGRGALALIRGQPEAARRIFEPLARGSILLRRHRALGRAYEALDMWPEAAAEYEEVLRNPYARWWPMDNPAIFVLDQFRLARIYERLDETERARHWYERFLDDWKDADPDIPELIEARERLAALG